MTPGLCIAVLGAESTGKTTLAAELAAQLATRTGLPCTWVPELLRGWCERAGRTPRVDEQAAIAASQAEAIDTARHAHALVVCDTTPLMTAVYSRLLFGDASLDDAAINFQRRCSMTLLTAIDLPWVADPAIRDGPHVQVPVDTLLRQLMQQHGLDWSVVSGSGDARLQSALAAVAPLLGGRR